MEKHFLHRRGALAGLGSSLALGVSGSAFAQDQPAPAFDLSRQTLTRFGATVTLNGHRSLFLIDTGAVATSIADTLVETLALPAREPFLVHGTTGAEVAPSVEVDRLLLQGLVSHSLRCPVFSRSDLGADGLLGLDVLDRYRLSFDLVRRQASLTPPPSRVLAAENIQTRSRRPANAVRTERGTMGQLMVTQVSVEGQDVVAFIDSGSQQSIGNLALLSSIGGRSWAGVSPTRPVLIHGVAGRAAASEVGTGSVVQIGQARLGDVPMLFADLYCFETLDMLQQPALLIGADLLARFRLVTIDFARNILSLSGQRNAPGLA